MTTSRMAYFSQVTNQNVPACPHVEAVRLVVQQGERLRINQGTLAMHDTALGIASRAGSLEMVRTLLEHEKIAPDLENRWMESPLKLAVKVAHALVVDALVADQRVDTYSLREARAIATHESIRMAIQHENDGRRTCRGRVAASRTEGTLALGLVDAGRKHRPLRRR
jgi:hypothetical protein